MTLDPIFSHDPDVARVFNAVLRPGDKVLDIGANRGFFSVLGATLVGESGRVFAFEPHKETFDALVKGVSGLPVETFNVALGDREAQAKLYINKDNDGGHALWDVAQNPDNIKTRENPAIQPAEVKRLDDLMEDRDLSGLRLVKIDVEGAEHSVIKGAINTLVDYAVPYVVCEINDFALGHCGTSQFGLRSHMRTYGYREYLLNETEAVEIPKGTSPRAEFVFNILFTRNGKV